MKKFVFTSKNGMCPNCDAFGKRYYIQDRISGGKYEYALMSRTLKKGEFLRFYDKRKLAVWLNELKENVLNASIADFIIYQHTLQEYTDMSLIERRGRKFVLEQGEKELALREYIEPIQETGWFSQYRECLDMAKKVLCDMENKISGEQMTLF